MELKIVNGSNKNYIEIFNKYLSEKSSSDSYYPQYKDFLCAIPDKEALLLIDDKKIIGFVSYRYDIFQLAISSIYVDPTLRDYGIEHTLIRAVENYYGRQMSIIIRSEDTYMRDVVKDLGFFQTSLNKSKKYKDLFSLFQKDYSKRIPYTKVIINLDCLVDMDSKEYRAAKRILKLYGVKPRKETILAYVRSIKSVVLEYKAGKISADDLFKIKYQKFMKQYQITIDPTLCYRLYNSSKTKYRKGAKAFLKTTGKRKHIICITTLNAEQLKEIKSELKIQNVSKYYNMDVIDYISIKKIINEQRYRNLEEFCYIDSKNILLEILRNGIDTYLFSDTYSKQDSFYFKNRMSSFSTLSRVIRKKC